jgi:hypothetical protein
MLSSSFVDQPNLFPYGAGPEEEYHNQGVWEAHFCAVDEAIADGFDEDERLVVARVEDELLQLVLG